MINLFFPYLTLCQTPTFIHGAAQENNSRALGSAGNGDPTTSCWPKNQSTPTYLCLPDNPTSLSGNTIFAACNTGNLVGRGTPTLIDDKSQTYSSLILSTHASGQDLQLWTFANTVAGVHQLKLSFTPNIPTNDGCLVDEFNNLAITSQSCGTAVSATGSSTTPTVNITTTQAGCFIYVVAVEDSGGATPTWSTGSGFTATHKQVQDTFASEYKVNAPSGSNTCSFTMSITDNWNIVCIAVKPATQGTAPPVTQYIGNVLVTAIQDSVASYTIQFPCRGNEVILGHEASSTDALISVTTPPSGINPTVTFTKLGSRSPGGGGQVEFWHTGNITCTDNFTITVTMANATQIDSGMMFWDLINSATSSIMDYNAGSGTGCVAAGFCSADGTQAGGQANLTFLTSLTPLSNSGTVLCICSVATNGTTSLQNSGFQENQDNNNLYGDFQYSSNVAVSFTATTDQRQAVGSVGQWTAGCIAVKALVTTTNFPQVFVIRPFY